MIEIKNIQKGYNGELVLKGISFNVNEGDFVSIMGRSGSGKSTLLNIIGGFMEPESGNILYNGKDIYSFSEKEMSKLRSNDFGFVFQSYKLISTLNVTDNILLTSSMSNCDKKIIEENFNKYTELLELKSLLKKYPDQLSGGQCQRVAIARALCYNPKVLILDEPTGALDRGNELKVMDIIKEINEKNKMTIVMVTHNPIVSDYARIQVRLDDGVINE